MPGKVVFCLLTLILMLSPAAESLPPVNKTLYVPPDAAACRRELAAAGKAASKYPAEPVICSQRKISIEIMPDRSSRVSYTEKYFLNGNVRKLPAGKEFWSFVQIVFPDGSYREYRTPKHLPLMRGSLVCVKYTRMQKAADPTDFKIILPLELPVRILNTEITVARGPLDYISHAVVPASGRVRPSVRKSGHNVYFISEIGALKTSPEAMEGHLRFIAGAMPDWNSFAQRLLAKTERQYSSDPELKTLAETLAADQEKKGLPKRTLLKVTANAVYGQKSADPAACAVWFCEVCRKLKIKAHPAAIKSGLPLNMTVPVNVFDHYAVFIPVQDGIRTHLWIDPSEKDGCLKTEYRSCTALVLYKTGGVFRKTE